MIENVWRIYIQIIIVFFNEKEEEVTVSVELSLIFNKNLISENDTFTACTIKN